MADKSANFGTGSGENVPVKMSDNGDGSYSISVKPVSNPLPTGASTAALQRVASNIVTCAEFTNATFATLVASVNSYLAGSSKKFISVVFYSSSLASVAHFAVVTEST